MEFIDLHRQQAAIKEALHMRMASVLSQGKYIMGPEVKELEDQLSKFTGARHCVACSSGSQALELVLSAWGIGAGDAVFTTAVSFIATAEAIVRVGATPIFVDIDPATYNIDPSQLELAIQAVLANDSSIYPLPKLLQDKKSVMPEKLRPAAILSVDLFGNPADYRRLLPIAKKDNLLMLEDGAQGFGSLYGGKKLCNCGCDAATTSFFPAKPLGCYGDGGAVFTNDDNLAKIVDSLRYHGRKDAEHKNDNVRIGCNGRLDTLQAAILLAKLEVFASELEARARIGSRYSALIRERLPKITVPTVTQGGTSNWAQYTIQLPEEIDRAKVIQHFSVKKIPVFINYPKTMPVQKSMDYLGYEPDDFPKAKKMVENVLSLPMHPYLTDNEQDYIVDVLDSACKEQI